MNEPSVVPLTRRCEHERRKNSRRTRVVKRIGWVLALVVVAWAIALCSCAVAVKHEMESVVADAQELKQAVLAQDRERIVRVAASIEGHSGRASMLSNGPWWRGAEVLPGIGDDLAVVREITSIADQLSHDVMSPLLSLTRHLDLAAVVQDDGSVDVAMIADLVGPVGDATTAVEGALSAVRGVDTDTTVPVIRDAVRRLDAELDDVVGPLKAVSQTVAVLPRMLGSTEPQNYLILFQNPAELRASGGIAGALALVHADAGKVSMTQQASSADFPHFDSPVLELDGGTRNLYGSIVGEYIQDVNLTPFFPQTAELAREMWRLQFGLEVDGVLAIDPIALSYVLAATGPLTLPSGDVLGADNTVDLLLSDVYERYQSPAEQDAFFGTAAQGVFDKLFSPEVNPTELVRSLARAVQEDRVRAWSAHAEDQAAIQSTAVAGDLAENRADEGEFGVYLNDATGAKMGYYLDVETAGGVAACREDGRRNYVISVTLTNTLPPHLATTLPDYVTAAGNFGVPVGSVRTLVNVYGGKGTVNLGVARGDERVPFLPTTDAGFEVSQVSVELAPGESTSLQFAFLGGSLSGDASSSNDILIDQTPVINLKETKVLALDCDSPLG